MPEDDVTYREPTTDGEPERPSTGSLRIFLNYRREDSSFYADRLYDDLGRGRATFDVFRDIDKIEPGADFVEVIEHQLDGCDVVLALIGKQWLSLADARGRRRLDDPADYVRLELEKALDRGVRLIPVRVQGADMPNSAELPKSLHRLVRRQAVELSDKSWRHDVETLAAKLEQLSAEAGEREREERDRLAHEEAERQRLAAEAAERGRAAEEEAERARREQEKRESEEAARQRAVENQAERERKERDRLAREEEKRRRTEQRTAAAAERKVRRSARARSLRAALVQRRVVLAAVGVVCAVVVVGIAVALRGGGEPSTASAELGPVPVPTGSSPRTIAGTARAGNTLTAPRVSWRGSPTAAGYLWQRCDGAGGDCKPVGGATSRTYRLGGADVGRRIRVGITASNAAGSRTVMTKATAAVARAWVLPASASPPTVSGTTQAGSTLTARPGTWTGTKPIEVASVWLRCSANGSACTAISGADGTSYTLGSPDIGRTIRVEERASNVAGKKAARSAATSVVRAQPEPQPTEPQPQPTEPEPVCPPDCPKPPYP